MTMKCVATAAIIGTGLGDYRHRPRLCSNRDGTLRVACTPRRRGADNFGNAENLRALRAAARQQPRHAVSDVPVPNGDKDMAGFDMAACAAFGF